MRSHLHQCSIALLAILFCAIQPLQAQSEGLLSLKESKLAGGRMRAYCKSGSANSKHLTIHFHGAADTVKAAFRRSKVNGVLVVVNFPGLSSAYSRPFASDGELFLGILEHAAQAFPTGEIEQEKIAAWDRITLSSFSAGYGAVREILKTPKFFERVDCIVAADSIYAGLQNKSQSKRQVDQGNMQHFLAFARLATEGKRSFVISHSAQPTPYASTTETADYLLHHLKLVRQRGGTIQEAALHQRSFAQRGCFSVLGFDGTSGAQHLLHLRHIDTFWNLLPRAAAVAPELKEKTTIEPILAR